MEIFRASKPEGLGGQAYSEGARAQVQGVVEQAPWGGLEENPSGPAPPRGKADGDQVHEEACADGLGAYCVVVGVVPLLEEVAQQGLGCACAGAEVREGDCEGRDEGAGQGGGGPSGLGWVGVG